MDWNDETILRLRALWDAGHSTAEIGRRMGVTKNAVVGKAHRLDLPARPSPIRRVPGEAHVPRREQTRRAVGPTLPAAPAVTAAVAVKAAVAQEPVGRPVVRPQTQLRAVAPPRPSSRVSTCCWPIGDPGTPSFRFCDAGALSNKPYCAEHAALAYVKVRDRREDAA